jgi:hypothetical protein
MAAFAGNHPPGLALRQHDGHAKTRTGADDESRRAGVGLSGLQGRQLRGGRSHGAQRGGREIVCQVQGG